MHAVLIWICASLHFDRAGTLRQLCEQCAPVLAQRYAAQVLSVAAAPAAAALALRDLLSLTEGFAFVLSAMTYDNAKTYVAQLASQISMHLCALI